jgi:hypothetical protein
LLGFLNNLRSDTETFDASNLKWFYDQIVRVRQITFIGQRTAFNFFKLQSDIQGRVTQE